MSKIFNRIFQFIMSIAMHLLPWRMPKIIEGAHSVEKLPNFIKELNYKKILIVSDKTLVSIGLLNTLLQSLDKENIEYILFDDVKPNPTDVDVENGFKLYKENNCEAIIAFGGGSPLDCAKAIGAKVARPKKSIKQLQGLLKVLKPIPTFFAIPTTSGTGSETTIAAVVTDSKTHRKASINDICLIPKYAVLDPTLTVGLPPHITSTTGLDALCHAVEAYTNNKYNTKLEKDLCKQAVRLIYDNLYVAYLDGSNLEARQNMQKAAFYAGRAFTRGCVGYVHAIGHTLGGLYGTPHGLAMAILLPLVMEEYGESAYDRLSELCDVCEIIDINSSKKEKAIAFINWIKDLNKKMNIPTYPTMIEKDDIDQIINWANKEANPLYPTPKSWNKKDFKNFINKCIYNQ